MSVYKSKAKPDETLDAVFSGRISFTQAIEEKKKNPSTSILGTTGIDEASKLRPSASEVAELGPDFEFLYNRDFRDQIDRPLLLIPVVNGFLGDASKLPPGQYITFGWYTTYPYSRGSVYITSQDVEAEPDFNGGYFASDFDVKACVWGYKKQREIARRLKTFDGPVLELSLIHI